MKNKRWLANIDKDVLCFFVTVLLMLGAGAGVMMVACKTQKENAQKKEVVSGKQPCDELEVDYQLPARTNAGDTLFVVGKARNKKELLLAMPLSGKVAVYKILGAENVQLGDTIVYNAKHGFLMKNLTQRNLQRQK